MIFACVGVAIWGRLKAFASDRRASVTVDFIVSIPILLGVLVLTSEYGRLLQMRSTLDNAVADATRYLSRVPLDPGGTGFNQNVVDVAEGLITSRVNTPYLAISAPEIGSAGGYTTIRISAAAGVASPALGLLSIGNPELKSGAGLELRDVQGIVVTASETLRHFGR